MTSPHVFHFRSMDAWTQTDDAKYASILDEQIARAKWEARYADAGTQTPKNMTSEVQAWTVFSDLQKLSGAATTSAATI